MVRAPVVEELDPLVTDEVAPVGRRALEAVAASSGGHGLLVPAGEGDQPRAQRRGPDDLRQPAEGGE